MRQRAVARSRAVARASATHCPQSESGLCARKGSRERARVRLWHFPNRSGEKEVTGADDEHKDTRTPRTRRHGLVRADRDAEREPGFVGEIKRGVF